MTDWEAVRSLFQYDRSHIHLGASQFIVSHPKHVRDAIEKYRKQIDGNPVLYTEEVENRNMQRVREAAAQYMSYSMPDNIAVTDSTTMGLGLIYTALNIKAPYEILTTEHDHYSQHEAITQALSRSGGTCRKVSLYKDLRQVTNEEIVDSLISSIGERTRVIGITWVHSSSGLKLPVKQIGKEIGRINSQRDQKERIILIVDGVHGFGIETEKFDELGCDFFISGCHKWLYGPRGTGIVIGTTEAWQYVRPVIPSFTEVMNAVTEGKPRPELIDGKQMTPGGFHSLEYRWALYEAFRWAISFGKENICNRVHELNRRCKEGLMLMDHVRLHTPVPHDQSSGIISFEIDGYTTEQAVEKLRQRKIIATASPYRTSWVRFTPGIINSEDEIDEALEAVKGLMTG